MAKWGKYGKLEENTADNVSILCQMRSIKSIN
jgi:hypothetical protein